LILILETADLDRDGKISPEEWHGLVTSSLQNATNFDEIGTVVKQLWLSFFSLADKNNNGAIESGEYSNLFSHIFAGATVEGAEARFNEIAPSGRWEFADFKDAAYNWFYSGPEIFPPNTV